MPRMTTCALKMVALRLHFMFIVAKCASTECICAGSGYPLFDVPSLVVVIWMYVVSFEVPQKRGAVDLLHTVLC